MLGHEVSHYCSMLINKPDDMNTTALKIIWERDLSIALEEKEWYKIIGLIKHVSRDIRIRLIQFKIVQHFNWYPCRLFRLSLKDSSDCLRCQGVMGDLVHALWLCPNSNQLRRVNECITNIAVTKYEFCPGLYILGNPRLLGHISKAIAHWIQTMIMIVRQIVMIRWKAEEDPLFPEWISELGKVAAYERISYGLRNDIEKYNSKWQVFQRFHSLQGSQRLQTSQ